jgi:hypothetical protein
MNKKSISNRWTRWLASLCVMLTLTSCGTTTQFISSWNAQDAQPVSASTMRIATVFFNSNESVRREGEDVMVRELNRIGGRALPSYVVVPEDPTDRERAKRLLEEAAVDAVVSMRVVSRERVADYGPSYWTGTPYYGSLWGYWGHGWGAAFTPNTDIVVGVETLLYSLKDGKLLWAGMSETFDADDVESAVKSIARKAVEKMREQNVLTTF